MPRQGRDRATTVVSSPLSSRLGEAASPRGGAGAEGDHPFRHLPPAFRGEHRGDQLAGDAGGGA